MAIVGIVVCFHRHKTDAFGRVVFLVCCWGCRRLRSFLDEVRMSTVSGEDCVLTDSNLAMTDVLCQCS